MPEPLKPAAEIAAATQKLPPGASAAYQVARTKLLAEEIELRRHMEAVAALRRALPKGPAVAGDFEFDGLGPDGTPTKLCFPDLFRDGTGALVIYHYMFPRHAMDTRPGARVGDIAKLSVKDQPCPSCTALLDQLNAAATHVEAAGVNLVVMAKTALPNLLAVARDRDWKNLRLVSSAGSDFDALYHAEEDGEQVPIMLTFARDPDGTVRYFWASDLVHTEGDPGQDHRAAGTVEPLWTLLDLTPGGRGDFSERLDYDRCCSLPGRDAA